MVGLTGQRHCEDRGCVNRDARNWASQMTHDEDRWINKQIWFIPDFIFPPREKRGSSEPDFKLKEILSLLLSVSLSHKESVSHQDP